MAVRSYLMTAAVFLAGVTVNERTCSAAGERATLTEAKAQEIAALRIAGQFEAALAALEADPALAAHDQRAVALRGLVLYDLGRDEEAELIAMKFMTGVQTDPDALLLVGRGKIVYGDIDKALPRFVSTLFYRPEDLEAQLGKLYCEAITKLEIASGLAIAEMMPAADRLPKGLYNKLASDALQRCAATAIDRGDTSDDVATLLDALDALDPENVDAMLARAHYSIQRNENDAANAILDRVFEKHSHRMSDVLYLRAEQALRSGDKAKALSLAGDAITISREHVPALRMASRLGLELEKYDVVGRYLAYLEERVIDLEVCKMQSRYFHARAKQAMAEKRPVDQMHLLEQAQKRCLTAAQLDPIDVENLERLIAVSEALGKRNKVVIEKVKASLTRAKKIAEKQKTEMSRNG